MIRKEAVLLVVFLLYMRQGFCCRCLPRRNEEKFCSANIALRVIVHDAGRIVGLRKIYRVTMQRIYRSTVHARSVNLLEIATGASSAACALDLTQKRLYLLTGYVEDPPTESPFSRRQIRVTTCDWVQDFSRLSPNQRRFINNPLSCRRRLPAYGI